MLSFIIDPLLSLLYPKHCGACGDLVETASDGAACRSCWSATELFSNTDNLCGKCGRYRDGLPAADGAECGKCSDHFYDTARSAGPYAKALAAAVLELKRVPNVPPAIEACFTAAFDRFGAPEEFTIVPVPLSKQRLHERGFNQAEILARVIAKHSGRPVDAYSLMRTRDTPMHRAAMDRKAREATVRNIFNVARPGLIRDRNILLIDDLMTSGSTVSYCAKALKKNGAATVNVLTLARAV